MEASNKKCPHLAFKKPCVREACPKYVKLQGVNPQTGQPVDKYDCSDAWLPILIVENTRRLNELGAAVEGYRNEVNQLARAVLQGANEQSRAVAGLLEGIAQKVSSTDALLQEAALMAKVQKRIEG